MALNLHNARNAKRNFVSRSALLASWVRLKRAAPYGAASPGLTGSHMFVMFLTLSNKTAHFKPSGRDGKKGQQPRNDASLSKYSHRYNEGCGARFMCLIKWTNIVSRLRGKKNQQTVGFFLCHRRVSVAGAENIEGKKEEGSIRWITEVLNRDPWKTVILPCKRAKAENLATVCRCECWRGACAGRQVLSAAVWGRLPIMETITQLTF